jgi:hypothetical protein
MSGDDRLAEIEARVAAATEGPWTSRVIDQRQYVMGPGASVALTGYVDDEDVPFDDVAADATFIAHARQDVPWLIAQVRARDEALTTPSRMADDKARAAYWPDQPPGEGGRSDDRA